MISTNPFSILAETIPSIAMQVFALVMVALAAGGTILDIIHKKNVKYFFDNDILSSFFGIPPINQ